MLHQTFDFFLGHARRFHDTINGGANWQEVFGDLNKSFWTTFSTTFNKTFSTTFSTTFGFCSIQWVLNIALGFETILIFAELDFGELGYLGFGEQAVEYLIAQIVWLAIKAGEVAKDIEPFVIVGLQLL